MADGHDREHAEPTKFKDTESKKEYDRTLDEAAARADDRPRENRAPSFDKEKVLLESGWGFVRNGQIDEALVIASPDYS